MNWWTTGVLWFGLMFLFLFATTGAVLLISAGVYIIAVIGVQNILSKLIEFTTITSSLVLAVIVVIAVVTFGTRVAPFILFGKGKPIPKYILYLGNYLPPAIMAMLIIYCLRNVHFYAFSFGIPKAIGVVTVAALH